MLVLAMQFSRNALTPAAASRGDERTTREGTLTETAEEPAEQSSTPALRGPRGHSLKTEERRWGLLRAQGGRDESLQPRKSAEEAE